ncbi:MAG: sugar-binding protein, partial [Bacteroidota bacterium]
MFLRSITLLGLLVLLSTTFLSAQATDSIPKRKLFTQKVEGEVPIIDGNINDEAWSQLEWSGDYHQLEPSDELDATLETLMKVLYDDKNLYVAYYCKDSEPDRIERRMSRRDGFPGDWVEVNIDSYHDLRTAFSFTISASGVKGDEFISNDGNNWDSNWNPIWYAKTQIQDDGWTAEIRIPLSQLRFGNAAEHVWGIQSTRRLFRLEERDTWQPVKQNASGWVSRFGELHGLRGIESQRQVEIQPYVVMQTARAALEEGNPFAKGSNQRISAGLDGRLGVTSDLTLDFTINPDFGQVEADPGALNLDGFQIFFGERR